MSLQRNTGVCVVTAVLAAGCASGTVEPPNDRVPSYVQRDAQRLSDELSARGFEVLGGGFMKLYTQDDCAYSYRP